ncbi:MAG: ATP synthase F1 subunit delta [Bacillota bacterium]
MIENEVAEKYAEALFDLAVEESSLESITEEFNEVIDVVEDSEELNKVINHPKLSYKQKKELLTKVFEGELSTELLNFLMLLADKKRIEHLAAINQEFNVLVEEAQNKLNVAVKSAVEISTKQQKKLKEKLSSILDKEISLSLEVDQELIGGLVLQIGDKVIDGSIQNYLQELELDLQTLEVS